MMENEKFINCLHTILIYKAIEIIIRISQNSKANIDKMINFLISLKEAVVNCQSQFKMLELECDQVMQGSDQIQRKIRVLECPRNKEEWEKAGCLISEYYKACKELVEMATVTESVRWDWIR